MEPIGSSGTRARAAYGYLFANVATAGAAPSGAGILNVLKVNKFPSSFVREIGTNKEAARVRAAVPEGFTIVTPGVRPAGAAAGDQKRVMTPADARTAGADMIVVGRPIRDALDPAAAAKAIAAEL